jgi:hypothetical protein
MSVSREEEIVAEKLINEGITADILSFSNLQSTKYGRRTGLNNSSTAC